MKKVAHGRSMKRAVKKVGHSVKKKQAAAKKAVTRAVARKAAAKKPPKPRKPKPDESMILGPHRNGEKE